MSACLELTRLPCAYAGCQDYAVFEYCYCTFHLERMQQPERQLHWTNANIPVQDHSLLDLPVELLVYILYQTYSLQDCASLILSCKSIASALSDGDRQRLHSRFVHTARLALPPGKSVPLQHCQIRYLSNGRLSGQQLIDRLYFKEQYSVGPNGVEGDCCVFKSFTTVFHVQTGVLELRWSHDMNDRILLKNPRLQDYQLLHDGVLACTTLYPDDYKCQRRIRVDDRYCMIEQYHKNVLIKRGMMQCRIDACLNQSYEGTMRSTGLHKEWYANGRKKSRRIYSKTGFIVAEKVWKRRVGRKQ